MNRAIFSAVIRASSTILSDSARGLELQATNEVVINTNESLFSDTCYISDINYMAQEHITPDTRSIGKVRYSHRGADCTLTPMENGMIKCVFDEPQRAMTPGQAAVFYQDGHVLCGGTIEKMMVN